MVHFPYMSGKIILQTVSETLREAEKRLRPKRILCEADRNQGWIEAETLMAHAVGKDKAWIVAHGNDCLSPFLRHRFQTLVKRRLRHEPVAHIIGQKDFYGRTFFVNKHVLIPRPETELMIDELKRHFDRTDAFTAWDVGTGSGAIAVTVALEFPNAVVVASDISRRAVRVAERNAIAHHIKKQISFVHGNLLTPFLKDIQRRKQSIGASFPLVILANLPYLPERDQKRLEPDVVAFEPPTALFSSKDGLDAIRELFSQISNRLNTNPALILAEFDSPQAKTIRALATTAFPNADLDIKKDIAKRDRLLIINMK